MVPGVPLYNPEYASLTPEPFTPTPTKPPIDQVVVDLVDKSHATVDHNPSPVTEETSSLRIPVIAVDQNPDPVLVETRLPMTPIAAVVDQNTDPVPKESTTDAVLLEDVIRSEFVSLSTIGSSATTMPLSSTPNQPERTTNPRPRIIPMSTKMMETNVRTALVIMNPVSPAETVAPLRVMKKPASVLYAKPMYKYTSPAMTRLNYRPFYPEYSMRIGAYYPFYSGTYLINGSLKHRHINTFSLARFGCKFFM